MRATLPTETGPVTHECSVLRCVVWHFRARPTGCRPSSTWGPPMSSEEQSVEQQSGDYKFVSYELLDEGRIARIMLNRPDARNAQNRGMLVELDDAFMRAEADDEVRVVILGGMGKMFSSGHDMGSKRGDGRVRRPTRADYDQRRDPRGRRGPDAPGVALLLQQHPSVAEPAQDHGGAGARHGVRGRPDAHVGVRSDRRPRTTSRSRTWSGPGSGCVAWSTSPIRGSSGRARPRSSC